MASASAAMLTMPLFENIELTTSLLMAQLGIEDQAELHELLATEATGSEYGSSSEEYAMRVQAQDLKDMLQIMEDHRLALTFDEGLEANYPSFRTLDPVTDPRAVGVQRIDIVLPVEGEDGQEVYEAHEEYVVQGEEYEVEERGHEVEYEEHELLFEQNEAEYEEREVLHEQHEAEYEELAHEQHEVEYEEYVVHEEEEEDFGVYELRTTPEPRPDQEYEDNTSDTEILEMVPSISILETLFRLHFGEEEEEASQQLGPYVTAMEHPRYADEVEGLPKPAHVLDTVKQIRCISCGDQFPAGSALRVPCTHYYCTECVVNFVAASTRDESVFPPKCCDQPIPSKLIYPFLPPDARMLFVCKTREYGIPTAERIYCPTPDCSAFLGSSEYITGEVTCSKCSARVCVSCKQRAHPGDSCSENTVTLEVRALARTEGWQTCPECKAVIELYQGCFHMTCRCGAQFCYLCATPWKQCSCPQWEENRL